MLLNFESSPTVGVSGRARHKTHAAFRDSARA